MKQRVLLINLPYFRLMKIRHRYFPVGLGSIAACVKDAGHTVAIYDMEKGPEQRSFKNALTGRNKVQSFHLFSEALSDQHPIWHEFVATVREFQPTVIGISIWSTVSPFAQKAAMLIKKYDQRVIIVGGGIHATVCDEAVLGKNFFDYIVRGEGERVFCNLLEAFSNKNAPAAVCGISFIQDQTLVRTPDETFIPDLDSLPFPDRDAVLNAHLYSDREYGCLVTSRGCPFRCSFCSSHMIWKREVRERSVERVYAEIEHVHTTYGCSFFTFFDDTFTLKQERIDRLCVAIKNGGLPIKWFAHGRIDSVDEDYIERMKQGRLFVMQFGIESGSQSLLDSMQKGIDLERALEIRRIFTKKRLLFWATFLIGHPYETEDDLAKTADFLDQLKPDLANINVYIPYPGSEKWKKHFQDIENISWQRFSPQSPTANFTQLNTKQWCYWKARIEAKADRLNRRTQRSFRAYIGLTLPKLFSLIR